MDVIQNIGKSIADSFSKSVEAYIAVALVGDSCFRILDKAKKTNKIKFVVGVNLPTPVEVLKELRNRYSSDVKIYRCEFFHPKVYLFRMKDGSLVAYVGSANFTDGGMNTNVELSVSITNQDTCKGILGWFSKVFEEAEPITDNFLANYKEYTAKWTKKRKERGNDFNLITKELDIFKEQKAEIEKELAKRRKQEDYYEILKSRAGDVEDIKESIDYYNDFKKIDIPKFLCIGSLGQIRQAYKNELINAVKDGTLRRLFKHLCDESVSVEQRITDALEGDYKVFGCGKNIITKILTVHNPKKYIVFNDITKQYLDSVHMHFLHGTKFSERYCQMCQVFAEVCKKTDIKDFAVLDEILLMIQKGYD